MFQAQDIHDVHPDPLSVLVFLIAGPVIVVGLIYGLFRVMNYFEGRGAANGEEKEGVSKTKSEHDPKSR